MNATSADPSATDRLRRLEVLLQDSNDAILMLDAAGNIREWNRGAERAYGYLEAQALSMNIRDLLTQDQAGEFTGLIGRLRAGETVDRYETQRVTRDGRLLHVITTPTLIGGLDGGELTVAITDRDITERKRAEETLRCREQLTRAIVETAVDAIITIDAAGRMESVNPAAERLFGYRADEMLGRNVSMLTPAPFRDEHDGYIRRYLLSGVKKIIGLGREVTGQRKDGSTFPMELAISEVVQADGRRFTGVVRDITEYKRIESDLRRQAMELASASQSFRQASEAADSATQAKSQFLTNMSHEIRTPLTAILGFSETLQEEGLSAEDRALAVRAIRRNGDHLLGIINDILDLSKIEAGKLAFDRVPCAPAQILTEVISQLRVRAEEKGLGLDLEYRGPVPETIYTAPVRLRQVLINLIGNAIKFTERGSVTVSVTLLPGDRPQLAIDVEDTGIGISAEQAAQLFQPFTQADSSTSRRFGGTGLGLTLSQRIAQLLGGDVVLRRSALDAGSQFRLTLDTGPLDGVALLQAPASAPASTSPPRPAADDHVPYSVLLADDAADNRLLVSQILVRAGARVKVVVNGKEAVEAALAATEAQTPFQVVLMDMQMPVMDGYEASSRLRARGYRGPIIALTAHTMAGDRERCLAAGCDEYLSKPISRLELLRMLRVMAEGPAAAPA